MNLMNSGDEYLVCPTASGGQDSSSNRHECRAAGPVEVTGLLAIYSAPARQSSRICRRVISHPIRDFP